MELFIPIRKVGRARSRKKRRTQPARRIKAAVGLGAGDFFSDTRDSDSKSPDMSAKETAMVIFGPRDYLLCAANEDHTRYATYFNDEQDVQIAAAEQMGVEPGTALNTGRYVMLHNTALYYLHDVTYPYLTPQAADLLNKIGQLYQAELGDHESRLRVTSCLRTPESVEKLQRSNRNAVENSCHLYGTTFDISYSRMEPHEKRALAKALSILRESGYCYVKHERRQPCFHITIRK